MHPSVIKYMDTCFPVDIDRDSFRETIDEMLANEVTIDTLVPTEKIGIANDLWWSVVNYLTQIPGVIDALFAAIPESWEYPSHYVENPSKSDYVVGWLCHVRGLRYEQIMTRVADICDSDS